MMNARGVSFGHLESVIFCFLLCVAGFFGFGGGAELWWMYGRRCARRCSAERCALVVYLR